MLKFIVVSVFVIVSGSCAADRALAVNPKDFDTVMEEGTRAVEAGDYDRAYRLALPFAMAGNPDAQFAVALILGWGFGHDRPAPGTQERERESLRWIRKAANQGHQEAANALADAYENGWYGMPSSIVLSNCWRNVAKGDVLATVCASRESELPSQ